jgi:hypothetical protein
LRIPTHEHSGIGNDEKCSSTNPINKESACEGCCKIPDLSGSMNINTNTDTALATYLQATIDRRFGVYAMNADTFQNNIYVI